MRPADIAGVWAALAKLPNRTPAQRKRDKLAAKVWRSVERDQRGRPIGVKRPALRAFSGELVEGDPSLPLEVRL